MKHVENRCQDLARVAAALRMAAGLELRGEGEDAAVRGVEDYSVLPHEEHRLIQHLW